MTTPLQTSPRPQNVDAGTASGPAIDLVRLSAQSLGDRDLELELLALFDRQAEQILMRLEAGVAQGERRWLGDLCHTLRGSAQAVGAMPVAAAALHYGEALAACSDAARLADLRAALALRVREARAQIAELLKDA